MASTAQALNDLLNSDSDDEKQGSGVGLPTKWGSSASNTDVIVILQSRDGPSSSNVARTSMAAHGARLRAGASGQVATVSKTLVRELDRRGAADGKKVEIVVDVASSDVRLLGPQMMDFLYGKPLQPTPKSAVHLLLLANSELLFGVGCSLLLLFS